MDKHEENSKRREDTVDKAFEAANKIILEGSDGTVEDTNYLTAEVARKFVEVALMPFGVRLLERDVNEKVR